MRMEKEEEKDEIGRRRRMEREDGKEWIGMKKKEN